VLALVAALAAISSGVFASAVSADPSSGDSAGLNSGKWVPAHPGASLSDIVAPTVFKPSQVSSPLDKFYYGLLAEFPNSFGGETVNSNGSYNVLEVDSNPTFESTAQSEFDALPAQFGVAVAPSLLILTFKPVTNTLQSLYANRQKISDSMVAGHLNPGVNGVGIDEGANRILVESFVQPAGAKANPVPSPSPVNSTQASLVSEYGPSILEFSTVDPPHTTANRYADLPPWNGGDQIVSPADYCTTGPGIHNASSGVHAILTAGHCAYEAGVYTNYFNTVYYAPNFTLGDDVGIESSWVVGGTTVGSANLDFGNIVAPGGSSDITWTGSATRTYITGWFKPASGNEVCEEGSVGGEQCNNIGGTDLTIGPLQMGNTIEYVKNMIQVDNGLAGGDSGGTTWCPTIFGPLVVGINTGADNSGPISWQEEIEPILYVDSLYYGASVVVNTVSSP
jgi:hypothetical protein